MKIKRVDNIRLGIFVMAGAVFLIFSLYMIGRNRNLFGSTFSISANFHTINGLKVGNNVRFSGIDVGTVKKIEITSDTSVFVTMIIDKSARKFIKQNAIAYIGTDGLMGNKLININSQPGPSDPAEDGSVIETLKPVETDEMLRTLNTTNDNIAIISGNLKDISAKLNNSNSLWNLLADTIIASNLKNAMENINRASSHTEVLTKDVSDMISKLKAGHGLAETLFTDTLLAIRIKQSIIEIQTAGNNLNSTTAKLKETVDNLDKGKGTVNMLLSDSVTSEKLRQSITNIEQGTSRFNENMEALKHNFLFKRYFKKQEQKKGK